MTLYFDTSFLLPLVRDEPKSALIQQFFAKLPRDRLAVSYWSRIEVSSALGRLVRMRELDRHQATAADAQFEAMIGSGFAVLLPAVEEYALATRYLSAYTLGLRAGDALHLAIAANNRAQSIFTLDKGVLSAGAALNLPTTAGIEEP